MFGFDGKTREQRQAEKRMEQLKREWRSQVDDRIMRAECRADLLACQKKFETAIFKERLSLRDRLKRTGGYSQRQTERCKNRIKNAAIGIMIVEDALDELEHAGADFDINATMNSLNLALRQLGRISDSTPDLGGFSFKMRLRRLYSSDDELSDILSQIPLPDDLKVEDSLLEALMQSDKSFEECRRQSAQGHTFGMNGGTPSPSYQALDNLPDIPGASGVPVPNPSGGPMPSTPPPSLNVMSDEELAQAVNALPEDKPDIC